MTQHVPKFQEEYSAKIPALTLLINAGLYLQPIYRSFLPGYSFDKIGPLANNIGNTTATPLNNAQPWRFFYACRLGGCLA